MPKGPRKSLAETIQASLNLLKYLTVWSGRIPKGETPSLIAIRSLHEHSRRRKRWNRAFNSAAVKDYETVVQRRALQLVDELEKQSMKYDISSVNLAEWLSYFS